MITIRRDVSGAMRHTVSIRDHMLITDASVAGGGEDAGPDPHDLYDAALGACKALTMVWYAKRKSIALNEISVTVVRDNSAERQGIYRLRAVLELGGDLSDAQKQELCNVAAKCPVHKLMTVVTTEIETVLDEG